MQALLASLVFSMSVKDEAFKVGMAQARAQAKKTDQDFQSAGKGMTASVQSAAREVDRAAMRIVDSLANAAKGVRNAGLALTAGLTLPIGAMGKISKDAASDFQSAMGLVQSAMLSASPEQLDKLREAALALGPAVGKSAIEAAGAIEALAKNGMSASAILGGGLKSALTLAVTGQTDLASAADLTTDVVAQFGKSTAELPGVVNRVVGALDASKLSFDDYRLAAGQAGGVTGSLGYTFEDFNTALAATAPLFDSGSQAGTSFRAFLTSLAGKSEDAKSVMKDLGLELYNTDGSAKSLAAIADELQQKMGNLSDEAKNVALDKMFGADGGQTAVALIKLGAEGINDVAAAIDKVTADQKMAILLDGEAAATQRLASAWEKLKIVIGEAGILQALTMIKNGAAAMIDTIASAPPWMFKVAAGLALAAAAAGPLVLVAMTLGKLALPLLVMRLAPIALGLSALINPMALVIGLLARLAVSAVGAAVVGRLGAAMLGFAGPVGLAITALIILLPLLNRKKVADDAVRKSQEGVNAIQVAGADIATRLAAATGKARDEALKAARANQEQAKQALLAAQANVIKGRSELALARAAVAKVNVENRMNIRGAGGGTDPMMIASSRATGRVEQAEANQWGLIKVLETATNAFGEITSAIKMAEGVGSSPKIDMSFDDPTKKETNKGDAGKSAADIARDDAQYRDDLGRARVAELQAQAEATGGIEARYRADMAGLEEERAAYVRQLALDDSLNAAKRATLLAERDKETAIRVGIAEDARSDATLERDHALDSAMNEAEQERIRATLDLVDSLAARRAGELRLLDKQREQEDADMELILATKATSSAEWQNAQDRKRQLDGVYAGRRAGVMRGTETAVETYARTLGRSSAAIGEDIEASGVSALQSLNSEMTDAIMNAKGLADAFASMGRRIIASLIDIAVQQAIIKPLANSMFGTADASGNRTGGWLTSLGATLGRTFGGGKALGGGVRPSEWYVVGERGPELFAPGVSGTVIPNGGRGSADRQPTVIQLVADEGATWVPRVQAISGSVAVQTVSGVQRSAAMRGRQRY